MTTAENKPGRTPSPLWHRALERYREELAESDDYQSVTEVGSLEDLLNSTKSLEPLLPRDRSTVTAINRLEPTLKFVDDFSAVIAVCFGADAKLTAFVWGSIRLLLTHASSAGDTLKDVLDMLEELSLTLPRFKAYENSLPVDRALEKVLVDVYAEVICFYARSIHFFRTHPHVFLHRDAWDDFRGDFSRTIKRIRRLSSDVEVEAESARMREERSKYREVLEVMSALKEVRLHEQEGESHYFVPSDLSPRFWGREDALHAIHEAIGPEVGSQSLKSFALYGMGGVGKTQIALQYANRNRDLYKTILWVAADNVINMGQSFREISKVLGLQEEEMEMQDVIAAILKVKNWLTNSRSPWLLIFDNADDLEVLRHAWPANGKGSVLLTTRDASACCSPASFGFHVEPLDEYTGSKLLLNIVGLDSSSEENRNIANEITQALGGLPLALNQIGGFISQRRMPLRDFIPLYERNAAKIDSRKTGISSYEHTLSTVWEISISKMSGDASTLLGLLPFFQPDGIREVVLVEGSRLVGDPNFEFLHDEMDLGDAEEVLLKAGLIDKTAESSILSMHRLVQGAVVRGQTEELNRYNFEIVVGILSWGFPDTWSQDVGHQIAAWNKCEYCLPHVHHLVCQRKYVKVPLNNPQRYGELLLRSSWYLYERECYEIARNMINAALEAFEDKGTLAYASTIDLLGLIDLDMSKPTKALESFTKALDIRKRLLGSSDPLVASSLNNIALAYTEQGKLEKAYTTHQEAIKIRLDRQRDRIGNSYSNLSSLLLRMGKPDEAEDMLKRCPALKEFTDDTFLNTGNPRFSGDMVLLSRIRSCQGRLEEAMRLASKALAFRQHLLGNRLKTCDSLYDVATLLWRQGKVASAIELLTQLVEVADSMGEGKGQLARAYFKLAILYNEKGRAEEGNTYRQKAGELRRELRPDLNDAPFTEESFGELCLWMLW